MKDKTTLFFQISILFFVLISCQKYDSKKESKLQKNLSYAIKKEVSKFSGNFAGINNQKEIFITLKPESNSNKITGVLTMNGEQAQINATEINGNCNGKITENNSAKSYSITMKFINDKLNFSITFPEYNNQILILLVSKTNSATATEKVSSVTQRNPDVIGKWRFTEVLSSGSGEFYTSFSTDYFIKINADGTATTWTGKSAGGSNALTIDGGYGTNIQNYQWYTSEKTFHFINPQNNKEEIVNYYAEPSRMMFSFGNNKRVYQRVN